MGSDLPKEISREPKKTIAVLGENMAYYIPIIIFDAIRKRLAQTEYTLRYFAADAYKSPYLFESQANILYNFVLPELVDGVIIISNTLGVHSTRQEFIDLCSVFKPLPIVSIGMQMEGTSNVLLDNAAGMIDAVSHLIEDHDYKKIAFLGGSPIHADVISRFSAFKKAHQKNGMAIDPSLMFEGNFNQESGTMMVEELLDNRGKNPGRDVDAIVCCNDYMAAGVLLELQDRGIKVPEDIALTGFDNIPFTDCITPSLSSISQPFDLMAVKAAELLLEKIQGKQVSADTFIKSQFIPRRSCGCAYSLKSEDHITIPKEINAMIQSSPEKFLMSLNNEIIDADTPTIMAWKQTLSHLRNQAAGKDPEGKTQFLLGKAAYNTFYTEKSHDFLFTFGISLKKTFQISELLDILKQRLPEAGIERCCLCLYENPEQTTSGELPAWSRMIMAFDRDEHTEVPEEGIRFETSRLIPPEYAREHEAQNWIILPLFFQEEQIGFTLMDSEIINEKFFYYLIVQINNALKGTLLFQENQKHINKLAAANATIKEFNKKLKDENLRMNMEMEVARKIQTALLPSAVGSVHPDFKIAAAMIPTEEVGGDYYDVLLDRKDTLWLGIGDVSGHGLKPGMIMMMTQTIQTALTASYNISPREAVIFINRALVKNVMNRMNEINYMTCTLLKYMGNGVFQYAGLHLDMFIYRRRTKTCDCFETRGTWLNLVTDIDSCTENLELKLETGDVLILYTDGITESKNMKNQMLGNKGLIDFILRYGEKSVEEMHELILEDVKRWNSGRFKDDLSLVLVQRII